MSCSCCVFHTSCCPFLFGVLFDRSSKCETKVSAEMLQGIGNVKLFSYKELRIATEDFNPLNKIGEGGFGQVYKGTLKDGRAVAIKVLATESKQGVQQFLTEVNVISEIEHENLVKLYGCCVQENHRILVYNYLQKNSIAQSLLGGGIGIHFSWEMRYKICVGVARGLAHLHEELRPYIVHRDIKASNILLDEDMTPKISDFGLARIIPPSVTHVSTRVAGTIGYLAPEYAIGGRLTRKADVYSFGVLLMEIVSGRCNGCTHSLVADKYLVEKAWELYEGDELVELVDGSMVGDFNVEEACRFLMVGLLCTQDSPRLRPSMSSVVKMLIGNMCINSERITRPGLLLDLKDLKIGTSCKAPRVNRAKSNRSSRDTFCR